jgi:hypothetical protein
MSLENLKNLKYAINRLQYTDPCPELDQQSGNTWLEATLRCLGAAYPTIKTPRDLINALKAPNGLTDKQINALLIFWRPETPEDIWQHGNTMHVVMTGAFEDIGLSRLFESRFASR